MCLGVTVCSILIEFTCIALVPTLLAFTAYVTFLFNNFFVCLNHANPSLPLFICIHFGFFICGGYFFVGSLNTFCSGVCFPLMNAGHMIRPIVFRRICRSGSCLVILSDSLMRILRIFRFVQIFFLHFRRKFVNLIHTRSLLPLCFK